MKRVLVFIILAVCILQSFSIANLEKKKIDINGNKFIVEIADTQEKREHGLAGRIIKQNEGMLFILDEIGHPIFWMKGCLEPLDIIWINQDKIITEIEHNVPLFDEHNVLYYMPLYPTKYVLELKGGTSKKLNIKVGDRVRF